MKSRLLAAVAIGAVFLVAPASAQVKIGILNDQSRVYADSGGKYSLEAARMAVEDFGGEVLGQKIEIVTADHQNKPDLATAIARRWYDTEGVDMITELTTSSVALAVQELSKEKKKIDIVVGAATSRITGDACTPYSFHWAYDTRALAVGTGGALVESGGDTWFFLTADYAFGYALEKDTRDIVTSKGGKVLGSVRVPLNSSDFSSFLLKAQNSKAKIIGLANAGLDTTNSIKQAAELRFDRYDVVVTDGLVKYRDPAKTFYPSRHATGSNRSVDGPISDLGGFDANFWQRVARTRDGRVQTLTRASPPVGFFSRILNDLDPLVAHQPSRKTGCAEQHGR